MEVSSTYPRFRKVIQILAEQLQIQLLDFIVDIKEFRCRFPLVDAAGGSS